MPDTKGKMGLGSDHDPVGGHADVVDFCFQTPAGFDHVVYGWIFFALVLAIVMGSSWRHFDRGPNDRWFDPARLPQPLNRRFILANFKP